MYSAHMSIKYSFGCEPGVALAIRDNASERACMLVHVCSETCISIIIACLFEVLTYCQSERRGNVWVSVQPE
jgi:hypothetical protein